MEEELYECLKCGDVNLFNSFTGIETDYADTFGVCPSCRQRTLILFVASEEDEEEFQL